MKNKLMSICITLVLIFISIISVEAIAPTPRIDLDDYQLTVSSKENVYASGTLSLCKGQFVGVYDSSGRIMYNFTQLGDTNSSGSFKVQIPVRYLNNGTNIFKIKSSPIKGIINGSNPKTLTVIVKDTSTKKDQTITVSSLTLYKGEIKNLNAKVSSNLPLTYKSNNSNVVTVDAKGNVSGRSKGSTSIVIKQAGNDKYNSVSKTVSVTVKEKENTNTYTVVFNPNGGKGSNSSQK